MLAMRPPVRPNKDTKPMVVPAIKKEEEVKIWDPNRPFKPFSKTEKSRFNKEIDFKIEETVKTLQASERELELLTEELRDPNARQSRTNDGFIVDDEFNRINKNIYDAKHKIEVLKTAKKQLENDRYGRCLECYIDIDRARLFVKPDTEYCKDCIGKLRIESSIVEEFIEEEIIEDMLEEEDVIQAEEEEEE
jgi:RNA polymerase-binding transcription factor DksA